MGVRAALRNGALFGIVLCQAVQAARASRRAALRVAPGPWLDNTEDNYDESIEQLQAGLLAGFCNQQIARPGSGEIVTCLLSPGHAGKWHVGPASNVAQYTWPNEAYEEQPQECGCTEQLLQADLVQTSIDWRWRIYDRGCDEKLRLYAEGSSEDLDSARDDVVATMRLLADNNDVLLGDPVHSVEHHVTAAVSKP